jgi:phosphate:Na+ symporter
LRLLRSDLREGRSENLILLRLRWRSLPMRYCAMTLGLFALCGLLPGLLAAAEQPPSLGAGMMTMGLCGGLALFLFGMEQMTEALKAAAGGGLQAVLARLTSNRFSGALTGALVTAIIQSSSVTTVLVVGFVSAGLMGLNQSIGVILGANIGTTVTAQIIAFRVTKYALLIVAVGFFMSFIGRRERVRQSGHILLGLGLVFLGMAVMGESMAPLRQYPPFLALMAEMASPLLALLVGALFTAVVQSSSATTGIVIVLASQGFVPLSAGIALALGANVGTCVTAILASFGKSRAALRAAAVHVLFNLVGVLLWVGFIDNLAALTQWFSPQYPELMGVARLAAETPRQIANANTLFNVINTLVFIGFTPLLGRLVVRLFPDRPRRVDQPLVTPKYLDRHLLATPSAALNVVRLEIGHLGQQVMLMLATARTALGSHSEELFLEVEKADDIADILHREILEYLSLIGKRELTEKQIDEYFLLTQAADTLESIGDLLESDFAAIGTTLVHQQLRPSPKMYSHLERLYSLVFEGLESAIRAVVDHNQGAAQEVLALRMGVNSAVADAFQHHVGSLAKSDLDRIGTLQLEFELIDKLKQIYTLSKRIARLFAVADG